MRILLVSPVPPEAGGAGTGGIATHAWGLATHLVAAGHEVALLADNMPYGGPRPVHLEGVALYAGKSFGGSKRTRTALSPAVAVSILRAKRHLGPTWRMGWVASAVTSFETAVRDFRPDVVHVHGIEGRLAVALHTLRHRAPLLATTHSTHYFEYAPPGRAEVHRGLVERNLAVLDRIVFVSRYLERRYSEAFPQLIRGMHAEVIINPLDTGLYAPGDRDAARRVLRVSDRERMLLFVGSLIERKRPELFIDAVARLQAERGDIKAFMIGDGPLRDLVIRKLAACGLQDVVTLERHKSQGDLVTYYTAADTFVLPSSMESFGLVAVEAMLCGCPVVGTFEAMQEVVAASAGVYVDTADEVRLAEVVGEALGRAWDRGAVRSLALGYDWSHHIGEFVSAYEDAIADL